MLRNFSRALAVLGTVVLLGSAVSKADTIWTRSGKANPYQQPPVKIQKVEEGRLIYRVVSSDRQADKPLEEVWQIKLDNDAGFSAAEEAFATEKFEAAVTAYQKVLDSNRTEWIRYRATIRLVEAANKAGNFPMTARAYAELVKLDPAAAAKHKPEVPAGEPGKLDGAVAEVQRVLGGTGLSADQGTVLRTFLLELARANGNDKLAQDVAGQLSGAAEASAAVDTPGARDGNDAKAPAPRAGVRADTRIQVALTALSAKEYDKALKEITNGAADFVEPEQQVEALYCRGEARAGLAGQDATKLKDAALDFMRVVTRAKEAGIQSPRVPQSLLRTAQILEQIKANAEALALYQQIAQEYKDDPAAEPAADGARRLQAAAEKAAAEG